MKMSDAQEIISKHYIQGFRVSFEVREGGVLRADHFPESGEPLIPTESEAWALALDFAKAGRNKNIVNVYVTDNTHVPVKQYKELMFNMYSPGSGDLAETSVKKEKSPGSISDAQAKQAARDLFDFCNRKLDCGKRPFDIKGVTRCPLRTPHEWDIATIKNTR